jgi:hypothetical protein
MIGKRKTVMTDTNYMVVRYSEPAMGIRCYKPMFVGTRDQTENFMRGAKKANAEKAKNMGIVCFVSGEMPWTI